MILVDSSIWINHIAHPEEKMRALLAARQVLMHPFVAGEVLVGSLADRPATQAIFASLEQAPVMSDTAVQANLENWRAYNRGVGYIDMHLLSSAHAIGRPLWTRDKRLGLLAEELGLRFVEP